MVFNLTSIIKENLSTGKNSIIKFYAPITKSTTIAIIIDEENKIVSTPAYMLADNITEAASGIEKLVQTILKWV